MGWFTDPPGWIQLTTSILAIWRIAYFLVYDAGPWNLAVRLRERVGIRHDDQGAPTSWEDRMPTTVFTCVLCMSLWTTPVVYGILWGAPYLIVLLGAWGAASLLELMRR